LSWADAKEKYENNKTEIEQAKKLQEKKVIEKASTELLRKVGNQLFMDKRYEEAASTYTRAINTDEGSLSAVLYSNRSAAYLYLNQKEDALKDALIARQLSFSRWPKAYYRVAKAKFELGLYTDAYQAADIGFRLSQSILECQDRHISDLKCTAGDLIELSNIKNSAMIKIEQDMFDQIPNDTTVPVLDGNTTTNTNTNTTGTSDTTDTTTESATLTYEDRGGFIEEEIKSIKSNDNDNDNKAEAQTLESINPSHNYNDDKHTPSSYKSDPIKLLLSDSKWDSFLSVMDENGPSFALKWAETDTITNSLMQQLKVLMATEV